MVRGLQQGTASTSTSTSTSASLDPSRVAGMEALIAASEAAAEPPSPVRTRTRTPTTPSPPPVPSPTVSSEFAASSSSRPSIPERNIGLGLDLDLNLNPRFHPRVDAPIVRPAKQMRTMPPFSFADSNHNNSNNSSNSNNTIGNNNNNRNNDTTNDYNNTTNDYNDSILSRLFEPDRKSRPELWEFVRLVAPGPANRPPPGRYKWRSKDAVAAYCLRCRVPFTYTPGTSQTIRRHMVAYHWGGRSEQPSEAAGGGGDSTAAATAAVTRTSMALAAAAAAATRKQAAQQIQKMLLQTQSQLQSQLQLQLQLQSQTQSQTQTQTGTGPRNSNSKTNSIATSRLGGPPPGLNRSEPNGGGSGNATVDANANANANTEASRIWDASHQRMARANSAVNLSRSRLMALPMQSGAENRMHGATPANSANQQNNANANANANSNTNANTNANVDSNANHRHNNHRHSAEQQQQQRKQKQKQKQQQQRKQQQQQKQKQKQKQQTQSSLVSTGGGDSGTGTDDRDRTEQSTRALLRWIVGSYQSTGSVSPALPGLCNDFAFGPTAMSNRNKGNSSINGSNNRSNNDFAFPTSHNRNNAALFRDFCKTLDPTFELPGGDVLAGLRDAARERLRDRVRSELLGPLVAGETATAGIATGTAGIAMGTVTTAASTSSSARCGCGCGCGCQRFGSVSVRRIRVVRILDGDTACTNDTNVDTDTDADTDADAKGDVIHTKAEWYYPVRLTFCGPENFRIASCVFAVVLGGNSKDNGNAKEDANANANANTEGNGNCSSDVKDNSYAEDKHKDKDSNNAEDRDQTPAINPYLRAVQSALREHGIPFERITSVVVRGDEGGGRYKYNTLEMKTTTRSGSSSSSSSSWESECRCLLERLDETVAKALGDPSVVPHLGVLRIVWFGRGGLGQDSSENNGESGTEKIEGTRSASRTTAISALIAYERLAAFLSRTEDNQPEKQQPQQQQQQQQQRSPHRKILDTLQPFRDAIQTLSADKYPTVGLAIPILRRIRDVLLQQRQQEANNRPESTASVASVSSGLPRLIHDAIFEELTTTFSMFLQPDPRSMWTMLLDPRLIAMRGLSPRERASARSSLIDQTAKLKIQFAGDAEKEAIPNPACRKRGALFSSTSLPSSASSFPSTMGGIFWGDDGDPTEAEEIDHQSAEEYANDTVDSYFQAVRSQRTNIPDPLLWWKDHRDQFPELARLARKWLAASVVYGRPESRDREPPALSIVVPGECDPEAIRRRILLHDNLDWTGL